MINQSILKAVLAPQYHHSACTYNESLYLELRRLFVVTFGDHNWCINKHISRYRPIRSLLANATQGLIQSSQIQSAISSLFQTGYFVTSISLPPTYYTQTISLIKSRSIK